MWSWFLARSCRVKAAVISGCQLAQLVSSLLEVEGSFNVCPCLLRKHVLTGGLKGFRDGGRGLLSEEAHSVGRQQLHFGFHHCRVLVLEGLAEDLRELLGSTGWISSEDKGGLLGKESTEELILGGCLLHVVRDRQQAEPVCDQVGPIVRVRLDECGLVLDDLTD